MVLAQGKDIGIGLQDNAEVAVETAHPELLQAAFQMGGYAHGTAAGTSAAMRRGEGLVQVQVHDVKAHVSGTHHAHQGVHVGPVVVQEAARPVHQGGNLLNLGFKEAQGVGVGHHDASDIRPQQGFQGLHVNAAVLQGFHLHHLEPANRGRCRVGAMGAVRHNHLGAGQVSAAHVILAHNHQARELSMGAGARGESKGMHARDGPQGLVHLLIHLANAGNQGVLFQRMLGREAGQRGNLLVNLGIVLHGAGTQRIEAGIHTEVHLGEVGVMPHHVRF